jgi:hypothetical protein
LENRFIPFSLQLGRSLSPGGLILFYLIWYFEHLSPERVCFAGNKKLMQILGVKKVHTLNKYKRELSALGLIIRHKARKGRNIFSTTFLPQGKGIRAAFMLSQEYTPLEKTVLMYAAFYPGFSIRDIAGKINAGKSRIADILGRRHYPLYEGIFINPLKISVFRCPKNGFSVSEKRQPSKYLKNTDITPTPEAAKTASAAPNVVSLPLLRYLGNTEAEIIFIKRGFERYKETPQSKVYQAARIALEYQAAGRIRRSKEALLFAILQKNKTGVNIPGEKTIRELIQGKARRIRAEQDAAGRRAALLEDQKKTREIKTFNSSAWAGLSAERQEAAKGKILNIADPAGTGYIKNFDLALSIALEQAQFTELIYAP